MPRRTKKRVKADPAYLTGDEIESILPGYHEELRLPGARWALQIPRPVPRSASQTKYTQFPPAPKGLDDRLVEVEVFLGIRLASVAEVVEFADGGDARPGLRTQVSIRAIMV